MTKPDLSLAILVFVVMFILLLISSRASWWNGIAEGDRRGLVILESNKQSWFGDSKAHLQYINGKMFYIVGVVQKDGKWVREEK